MHRVHTLITLSHDGMIRSHCDYVKRRKEHRYYTVLLLEHGRTSLSLPITNVPISPQCYPIFVHANSATG